MWLVINLNKDGTLSCRSWFKVQHTNSLPYLLKYFKVILISVLDCGLYFEIDISLLFLKN